MNKYLMLSATAVLASGASAYAGTHTFTFGSSKGGSYCDGGQVTTAIGGDKVIRAWIHENHNCEGSTSIGQGLVSKSKEKGLKNASDMSDNGFGKNYGIFSEAENYTLPGKIASGQTWTEWLTINGTTSFETNSGPLLNIDAHVYGKGTKSTSSVVRQLIQQRLTEKN